MQDTVTRPLTLRYASDCSGIDAAVFALRALFAHCHQAFSINVNVEVVFCSELPKSKHTHTLLRNNVQPRVLFADMHDRSFEPGQLSGPAVFTDGTVPLNASGVATLHLDAASSPIHFYMSGFECQDLSFANRNRKNMQLDPSALAAFGADSNLGRSERTLIDSCRTICHIHPWPYY